MWRQKAKLALEFFTKLGWFVFGAGCVKMGWVHDDLVFGTQWGTIVVGVATILATQLPLWWFWEE